MKTSEGSFFCSEKKSKEHLSDETNGKLAHGVTGLVKH